MPETSYQLVTDQAGLNAVVDTCLEKAVIAMDTEFARFNTYYPIVGLIQIYDGSTCWLIDPLALDDLEPLARLLTADSLLKVFHAGSEDMEVFQYALDVVPSPVFDTQIAGAALGVGFSMGYQAMVEHYLQISLPKDQTRSDWLARPLSAGQLDYAALDVIHLLEVYSLQADALAASGKRSWVDDECASMGQDIPTIMPPEECYLRLKGLWQLSRRELEVLRQLCAWREEKARLENVPRNRVLDQKALLSVARHEGLQRGDLQNLGMMPRQVRKFGDAVIAVVDKAMAVPEEDCPQLIERTDAPVNNRKLKRLRQVVDEAARRHSVAPELLTKRRHLEKLIRSEDASGEYHLPGELTGWREAIVGNALLSALTE